MQFKISAVAAVVIAVLPSVFALPIETTEGLERLRSTKGFTLGGVHLVLGRVPHADDSTDGGVEPESFTASDDRRSVGVHEVGNELIKGFRLGGVHTITGPVPRDAELKGFHLGDVHPVTGEVPRERDLRGFRLGGVHPLAGHALHDESIRGFRLRRVHPLVSEREIVKT